MAAASPSILAIPLKGDRYVGWCLADEGTELFAEFPPRTT